MFQNEAEVERLPGCAGILRAFLSFPRPKSLVFRLKVRKEIGSLSLLTCRRPSTRTHLVLHRERDIIMKVTEVKVFPVNEERLKAYVSITLDGCFVVRDLKVIQGTSGLFVAMPSKKRKDGQFRDIAHPLNQETRAMIEDMVFEAYENELKSMGETLVNLKRQKAPSSNYGDDY
jgi:stage V sporulation protein G